MPLRPEVKLLNFVTMSQNCSLCYPRYSISEVFITTNYECSTKHGRHSGWPARTTCSTKGLMSIADLAMKRSSCFVFRIAVPHSTRTALAPTAYSRNWMSVHHTWVRTVHPGLQSLTNSVGSTATYGYTLQDPRYGESKAHGAPTPMGVFEN
jgi:hypothetical protein